MGLLWFSNPCNCSNLENCFPLFMPSMNLESLTTSSIKKMVIMLQRTFWDYSIRQIYVDIKVQNFSRKKKFKRQLSLLLNLICDRFKIKHLKDAISETSGKECIHVSTSCSAKRVDIGRSLELLYSCSGSFFTLF